MLNIEESYESASDIAAANRLKIDVCVGHIEGLPISDTDKIKLAIAFGMSLALRSKGGGDNHV